MTSASILTLTDRENGYIRSPTYFEDEKHPRTLTFYEEDGLTLIAKKGVPYTLNTGGASGLRFTVSGPGIEKREPHVVGSSWSFTATADATYSIVVESATGDKLPGGGLDMPYYGSYRIDAYSSVPDDVGLTLPGSDILPIGQPLKGHLGTASDSDQAFFSAWRGNSAFFAAYSTEVKDVTVEIQSSAGEVLDMGRAGSSGMAVVSVTAPSDGMYKALVRSGGYRQEGDYEAFSGQRLDPAAILTVGRPSGDTIVFTDPKSREVWAWGGENQVQTGAGNDTIVGSRLGDDVISSGAGDDTIVGFGGLNVVDGGPGRDTFVVTGVHDDYSIEKVAGGLRIAGTSDYEVVDPSGTPIATYSYPSLNLLQGIEYVRFLDQTLDVRNVRWLRDWITLDRVGSETYKGFEALDEARLYEGARAGFSVSIAFSSRTSAPPERDPYELTVTVSSGEAIDTLYSVERLMFDDGGIAVDMYPGGTAHSSVAAMLFVWGVGALTDQILAGKVLEFFRVNPGTEGAASVIVREHMVPGAGSDDATLVDYVIAKVSRGAERWVDAEGARTPIAEWKDRVLKQLHTGDITQSEFLAQALLSPDLNDQVKLTGLSSTGLFYHDEPIPWGG